MITAAAGGRPVRSRGRHKGMAILIVLMALAIVMVLYFLDVKMLFKPSGQVNSSGADDRPWLEEDRILGPQELIEMPKAPKHRLENAVSRRVSVYSDGEQRGSVMIDISTNGNLTAEWKCQFEAGDRVTNFDASFGGNIDVEKTYSDENGTDKSRLFFIGKGKYTEQVYNKKTTRGQAGMGTAYLTGWLLDDENMHGKITITTDKKWSASYDFWTKSDL